MGSYDLSDEEVERLRGFLGERSLSSECPGCRRLDQRIHPTLIVATPWSHPEVASPRQPFPMNPLIQVICPGCGLVRQYDLNTLGFRIDRMPHEGE